MTKPILLLDNQDSREVAFPSEYIDSINAFLIENHCGGRLIKGVMSTDNLQLDAIETEAAKGKLMEAILQWLKLNKIRFTQEGDCFEITMQFCG